MAMLHLFYDFFEKSRLVAAYINHNLRPKEAAQEYRQLQKICNTLGVSFYCKEVAATDYAEKNGLSIEESARILRYQAFREIARHHNCGKIAVAHTADDQVENFFIRLIRGAGTGGVKGMQPRHNDIIRPLLNFEKKELQEYLTRKNIRWFEDSSNTDPTFLRNRVRLQLLPLLKNDFTPAINRQILQFMDILGEENRFLAQETEKIWHNLIEEKNASPTPALLLSVENFAQIDKAVQRRIIEKCIVKMQGKPSFTHIEQIIRLAIEAKSGELHLTNGLRVEKSGEKLRFHYPLMGEKKRGSGKKNASPFLLKIDKPGSYQLPENGGKVEISFYKKDNREASNCENSLKTLYLDADKSPFPLYLRSITNGDRFFPCNGKGSKKVARYLADKKIPLEKRKKVPLLVSDNRIAAIIEFEIDDAFKLTEKTRDIIAIRYIAN